jgi:hypothetical protein
MSFRLPVLIGRRRFIAHRTWQRIKEIRKSTINHDDRYGEKFRLSLLVAVFNTNWLRLQSFGRCGCCGCTDSADNDDGNTDCSHWHILRVAVACATDRSMTDHSIAKFRHVTDGCQGWSQWLTEPSRNA